MSDNSGYAGGYFMITFDQGDQNQRPSNGDTPSYVRSIDGGFLQGSVISEPVGGELLQLKHLGMVDIQPINVEAGMASSRSLLNWIKQTWNLNASRRSGRIDHGAPRGGQIEARLAQEFENALITEVTFPALSATAASESTYLKVQIQPERLKLLRGDELPIRANTMNKQLEWTKAKCRFEVGGQAVNITKIDSFTVKQQVKKLYTGRERLPELVPSALEIANLTVYAQPRHGQYLMDWYNERLEKGTDEIRAERTGALIFQSTDGKDLFEITLKNMGLYSLNVEKSTAGSSDIKLLKAGIYIESIDLQITGAFD